MKKKPSSKNSKQGTTRKLQLSKETLRDLAARDEVAAQLKGGKPPCDSNVSCTTP